MIRLNPSSHKLDFVFVLSLFTVFAAAAVLLVLVGASQYKLTTDQMDANYQVRTASSYLIQKIRQYDTDSNVTVTDLEGYPAISLTTTVDGVTYTDYVYYYDGSLMELLISDTSVYDLSSGDSIIEVAGFEPSLVNRNLLYVKLTNSDGSTQDLYMNLETSSGKEES